MYSKVPVGDRPEIAGSFDPMGRVLSFWVVRPRVILQLTEATVMIMLLIAAISTVSRPTHTLMLMSIGLLVGLAGCHVFLSLAGVHRLIVEANPSHFLFSIFGSMLTGMTLAALLGSLFPALASGCRGALTAWILLTLMVVALRLVIHALIRHHHMLHKVLVLGSGELTELLCKELSTVDSVVNSQELESMADTEHISSIVVADPYLHVREELAASLIDSKFRGLRIKPAMEHCETLCRKIWIAGLRPDWLLYADGFIPTRTGLVLKRAVDILCSLTLLLITSPLIAATAILVKLTSPGPVFYRQERVGLHGRHFFVFKFRTMFQEAEARTGPIWAVRNDHRITPVGRVLRKYRIDELPQLINVLNGEMSFVGPRPERPFFVEQLKQQIPYYELRHYVRPGITGWAQVMYPYGSSIPDAYEKLQYDLYYIKHLSVLLDIMILPKTLKVVLSGSGR